MIAACLILSTAAASMAAPARKGSHPANSRSKNRKSPAAGRAVKGKTSGKNARVGKALSRPKPAAKKKIRNR
jgi:hypothetical protein